MIIPMLRKKKGSGSKSNHYSPCRMEMCLISILTTFSFAYGVDLFIPCFSLSYCFPEISCEDHM